MKSFDRVVSELSAKPLSLVCGTVCFNTVKKGGGGLRFAALRNEDRKLACGTTFFNTGEEGGGGLRLAALRNEDRKLTCGTTRTEIGAAAGGGYSFLMNEYPSTAYGRQTDHEKVERTDIHFEF
jgi:hypothetical protein